MWPREKFWVMLVFSEYLVPNGKERERERKCVVVVADKGYYCINSDINNFPKPPSHCVLIYLLYSSASHDLIVAPHNFHSVSY